VNISDWENEDELQKMKKIQNYEGTNFQSL